MLAIFGKAMANMPESHTTMQLFGKKISPELKSGDEYFASMNELAGVFSNIYPNSIAIHIKPFCILASKLDQNSLTIPSFIGLKEDTICLFQGSFTNKEALHGNKDANEFLVVIDSYLKSGGEIGKWCKAFKEFQGQFAFVMYDAKSQTFIVSTDPKGTAVQCFWGLDTQDNLVISSNYQVAQGGSNRFCGAIPGGHFISNGKGLRSFETPHVHVQMKVEADNCPEVPPSKKHKV